MSSSTAHESPAQAIAYEFLLAMPKVELHVHLEGAMDSATIWEMAQRNGVSLPVDRAEDLRQFFHYRDFDHFVQAYYAATSTMLTMDDWRLMIDRFMAGQAKQNILYTEAFISASHHLARHDQDEWIEVLGESLSEGEERYGVRVRLIPDISRETPESSQAVLNFVKQAHTSGIALGLGLGGPEVGFPPELFTEVYAEARDFGMRVVAHAGETGGPESVSGAWQGLGAERIGHGFRVLEDTQLTSDMAAAGVPFELNPSSNYCIGVVPKDQPHPIRAMKDAGLVVTVNSDDPALFDTSLTLEYLKLHEQGFSLAELFELSQAALDASFLSQGGKAELRRAYQAFAHDQLQS